jgi:hypothetical protein
MKYVLTWETRANASEEVDARSLQVFSKWTPSEGTEFVQFVWRVDGRGGFAVVETEDVTLIARDTAIFGAFLDFSVYPVLDAQEAARIAGEAVEFRQSVSWSEPPSGGLLMLAGPLDLDELDRWMRIGWERRRGASNPYPDGEG